MKFKKVLLLLGLSFLLLGCNKTSENETQVLNDTSPIIQTDETTKNIIEETEEVDEETTKTDLTYINEMDEIFNIPNLPIVAEEADFQLAQYENISMSDLPKQTYPYEEVKKYVDSVTQEYISKIGEDTENYKLDKTLIKSLTFDEATTYEGLIDYYYKTYNDNLEIQRIDTLKNGCLYAVVKNSKINESSSEWRSFYNEYKNNYDTSILEEYDSIDDYIKENNLSKKYYDEKLYSEALISYKETKVVNMIANIKNFNKTEEEANKEIEDACEELDLTVKEYEEMFGNTQSVIENYKYTQVKDYIYSQTTFEDIYIDSLEELGYE